MRLFVLPECFLSEYTILAGTRLLSIHGFNMISVRRAHSPAHSIHSPFHSYLLL